MHAYTGGGLSQVRKTAEMRLKSNTAQKPRTFTEIPSACSMSMIAGLLHGLNPPDASLLPVLS